MTLHRDEAVVLRTQKLGEADRIITLLTRERGRVRAVARGVRRTSSKFGARLEPFSHVDVQIFDKPGRALHLVTQVETLDAYGEPLAGDYPRYTAGTAMLETAERFTEQEGEPALQQFLLLVGGLRALATGAHETSLVLDAYLLRSLAVAGYAPSFTDCAICGTAPEAERQQPTTAPGHRESDARERVNTAPEPGAAHRFFSLEAGGMVCGACRPHGTVVPARETVELLGALLSGDWRSADASDPRHRREGSGMVAAYLQWHLERGLRSLRLVERS